MRDPIALPRSLQRDAQPFGPHGHARAQAAAAGAASNEDAGAGATAEDEATPAVTGDADGAAGSGVPGTAATGAGKRSKLDAESVARLSATAPDTADPRDVPRHHGHCARHGHGGHGRRRLPARTARAALAHRRGRDVWQPHGAPLGDRTPLPRRWARVLGRNKESIAALLAAFFPRFPAHTADNQYHLQPLRHLYVLAVAWRGLSVRDADTGEDVHVPLELELNESVEYPRRHLNAPLRLNAPCLLPDLDAIKVLRIASPRYYPITIYPATNPAHRRALSALTLSVKRKTGHLSYAQDPHALRSILTRPVPRQPKLSAAAADGAAKASSTDFFGTFTEDAHLLAFARHFCDADTSAARPSTLPARPRPTTVATLSGAAHGAAMG